MVGIGVPTIRTTTCRKVTMQMIYTRPPRGQGGLYVTWLSERHYYGGSSKNFRVRWYEHLRTLKNGTHKNPHMQAVFNQHQQFEPEVLKVIKDPTERLAAEQVWLDANFKMPGCVNILSEAEIPPMQGRTYTEASKAKMSARKKGILLTPEHRKSLSEAQKRRHQETPMTEETRQKIAQGNREKKRPYVAERNRQNAGWEHTDEAKAKIAEASRKVWAENPRTHTEESKEKIRAARARQVFSEESMQKRSQSMKAAWARRKAAADKGPSK